MIAICALMELTCSWGSLIPSKFASKISLKLSGTPPNLIKERLRIQDDFFLKAIWLILALLEINDVIL